mmetsp:Transcript_154228/g.295992  ORF Transcript_154228/g.295992 Transcript_154228/m.295992 type:complete len:206 (-) Transcript_154228:336-953(-)
MIVGNGRDGPNEFGAVNVTGVPIVKSKRGTLFYGILMISFFLVSGLIVIGVCAATGVFSSSPEAESADAPSSNPLRSAGGAASGAGSEGGSTAGAGNEAATSTSASGAGSAAATSTTSAGTGSTTVPPPSSAGSCFMGRDRNGAIILCNVNETTCTTLGSSYWYPPGYINDRNTPGCCHCEDSCDHSQEWSKNCEYYANCQMAAC